MPELKYKRVLIKISGEVLAGEKKFGLDFDIIHSICETINKCVEAGAEIGIVVGGGNFWRGRQGRQWARWSATRADHMGMLATVMKLSGDRRCAGKLWGERACADGH